MRALPSTAETFTGTSKTCSRSAALFGVAPARRASRGRRRRIGRLEVGELEVVLVGHRGSDLIVAAVQGLRRGSADRGFDPACSRTTPPSAHSIGASPSGMSGSPRTTMRPSKPRSRARRFTSPRRLDEAPRSRARRGAARRAGAEAPRARLPRSARGARARAPRPPACRAKAMPRATASCSIRAGGRRCVRGARRPRGELLGRQRRAAPAR